MFEIKQLTENTFFYEAYSNVGIHRINEKEVVLIDACDHKRMVTGLDKLLGGMGLSVNTIIDTHCHVDHTCGNKYFKDKYGCRVLCTRLEQGFIYKPDMEPHFYNVGLSVDKLRIPFFQVEPVEAEVITKDNLPEGFEVIDLPGHSFEMIGVRTPDDVLFLADSLISELTWENYKLPFFYDVDKQLETLEMLKTVKARLYVPSHCSPMEDISGLIQYNIDKLREKRQMVFELCQSQSFEGLFELVVKDQEIDMRMSKYSMYAVMIRNLLQSLINAGKVYTAYENGRVIYRTRSYADDR